MIAARMCIRAQVKRLKQKNIFRSLRIAISGADQSNSYHMVTVRGRVIVGTNDGADEHIRKLAKS
jgi:hypothetical protein